jgi:hypothetical protein
LKVLATYTDAQCFRVLFSLGFSGRESKQKDGRSNGEESLDQDRHEAVSKKYAIPTAAYSPRAPLRPEMKPHLPATRHSIKMAPRIEPGTPQAGEMAGIRNSLWLFAQEDRTHRLGLRWKIE